MRTPYKAFLVSGMIILMTGAPVDLSGHIKVLENGGVGLLASLTFQPQQLEYRYDAAGNRVSRTILLNRQGTDLKNADAKPVSFEDRVANREIKIFPNPVQYALTVSISGYTDEIAGEYRLYSITGELVKRQRILSDLTTLEMNGLSPGTYLLNIVINGEKSVWKVVKE